MSKQKNKKLQSPTSSFQPSIRNTQYSIRNRQLLIIILFSLGLYVNTLFSDYTLDDTLMITQNKFTKMGFAGIKPIMTNDAFVGFFGRNKNLLPGGRYRPLSQVVFAIQYQFFSLNPLIGHLTNIVFYTLMCVLVFLLLNKLFNSSEFRVRGSEKQNSSEFRVRSSEKQNNSEFRVRSSEKQNSSEFGVRSSEKQNSSELRVRSSEKQNSSEFRVRSSEKQKSNKKTTNYLTFPFIITLLFAAHPLHTEVVANVKGCDEILGLILISLTILLALKYADKISSEFRVRSSEKQNSSDLGVRSSEKQKSNIKTTNYELFIIFFLFLLALLNKENAITFIGIIPLTLFIFRKISLKDHLIIFVTLLFSFAAYLLIRYEALGFIFSNNAYEKELLNNPFLKADTAQKYATIMLTWGKYLQLLLFPYNLTHDYYPKQIPIIDWSDIRAIIPFILYAGLFIYALYKIFRSKFPIIAYGILVYMLTFSIQSNLVFNIGTFMNERFMFISVLGFCIILAYFLQFKIQNLKFRITLLFIILLAYSVKTIRRNTVWKNDFTLFTTDVNTSSNSAKCNVSAGGMYFEKAKKETDSLTKRNLLEMAQHYITEGLSIHPYYIAGWILSGNVYLEMKEYMKASSSYETVLNMSPRNSDALNNLLIVAQRTDKHGLTKESLSMYKALYKYNPGETDNLLNLASVYAKVGRSDTALIILNSILSSKPDYYSAYNKMGEIYGRYYNDINKSLDYLNKALSIKGNDASILENLGVAYGIKGDLKRSEEYFKKAIEVKPDNPQVYRNLAGTYKYMGNNDLANQMILKAQKLEQKSK